MLICSQYIALIETQNFASVQGNERDKSRCAKIEEVAAREILQIDTNYTNIINHICSIWNIFVQFLPVRALKRQKNSGAKLHRYKLCFPRP